MAGFGIDVKDPNKYGDEDDKRICTHEISQGDQEKGRTAMENALQKCPGRERGLHDQRAGCGRRLGSPKGGRQG